VFDFSFHYEKEKHNDGELEISQANAKSIIDLSLYYTSTKSQYLSSY